MKKKVMLVFGTRPEAIKMAPLIKEFKKYPDEFEPIVTVTGQHRQMLDQVLQLFEIIPDYDLNIMKNGQDLYDITSRVLLGMRDIISNIMPDLILVHGDTTTSTSTALAAFYQKIPVGHIEAGLRTRNIYSPWPEEMNRQLTSRLATWHFAPTQLSRKNLLIENISADKIILTGNTVIDALHQAVNMIKNDITLADTLKDHLKSVGYNTSRLTKEKKLLLITGHRRENFGNGFLNICSAIKNLCYKYPNVDFVYSMHPNPNARKPINHIFGNNAPGNIFFIEPLDYLPFIFLMEKSYLILTDSGGIQEEAPGLGKPVLVTRDTTERPEAVEAGIVKLVGTSYERIISEVSNLIDSQSSYERMSKSTNPYGNGTASQIIVNNILSYFMAHKEYPDVQIIT